jgi:hypothetical protein
MRSRALEAPRPGRSERRFDPPPASRFGPCEQLGPRRAAPLPSTLTVVLRREHEAGVEVAPKFAPAKGRLRRDAPNFRRTTHFSKNEHPSFTWSTELRVFAEARRASRSWRFTRFGSPRFARGGGVLFRLRERTGFPLTLPSEPLPAGPHERCRRFTTRSAFCRRAAPENRKLPVGFCNQREGRAHPVAARCPAHQRVERWRRPSKVERAAKHRLPGWESSSRFTGRPDSTKLRARGTRGLLGIGSGHPCRTTWRPICPERR